MWRQMTVANFNFIMKAALRPDAVIKLIREGEALKAPYALVFARVRGGWELDVINQGEIQASAGGFPSHTLFDFDYFRHLLNLPSLAVLREQP